MTSGGCMHLTQRSRERDETLRGSESIPAREQILQGRACPKIFHDENPGLVVGGKKTWRNGTSAHGQELQGRLLVVEQLWFAASVDRRTAHFDDDRTRHQASIGLYGVSCDVGPGGRPELGRPARSRRLTLDNADGGSSRGTQQSGYPLQDGIWQAHRLVPVKRCYAARWVYVVSRRLLELRLFRIHACGRSQRLGQTSSIFATHEVMPIGANGGLCIGGVGL